MRKTLNDQLAALETKPLEGDIVKPAPDTPDIPEGGIPATGRSRRAWEIALATVGQPTQAVGDAMREAGVTGKAQDKGGER